MDDPRCTRIVLSPSSKNQEYEFAKALDKIWFQGGWTVLVDELFHLDQEMGLRKPINRLLTQGRDPGRISVVCGMQRPTIVSRFALGEATHIISFGLEGRDIKIVKDAAGDTFAEIAGQLPQHHFIWAHRPTKQLWVGTLDSNNQQKFIGEQVQ